MKATTRNTTMAGFALALAGLALPLAVSAQAQPIAVAVPTADLALVYRLMDDQQLQWNAANRFAPLGQRLAAGDAVITSANTRAVIRFTDDGSTVRLDRSSQLSIVGPGVDRNALVKTVNLELGDVWASVTRQGERNFQVRTPAGVAAVKGTEFIVRADATGTTVITLEGVVEFFNDAGVVDVEAGNTLQVATATTQPVPRETNSADLAGVTELIEETTGAGVAAVERVEVEIKLTNAEGLVKTMVLELTRDEAKALLGRGR
jgi:hypothetical protein